MAQDQVFVVRKGDPNRAVTGMHESVARHWEREGKVEIVDHPKNKQASPSEPKFKKER